MATALDIITAALRKTGVLDVADDATSSDASYALNELNMMIASWKAGDVDIEEPTLSATSSTLTVDSQYHNAIMLCLAMRLMQTYSRPVSIPFMREVDAAWRVLEANFKTLGTVTFDTMLVDTPTGRNMSKIVSGT